MSNIFSYHFSKSAFSHWSFCQVELTNFCKLQWLVNACWDI